jgi:sodium transport system permease protein
MGITGSFILSQLPNFGPPPPMAIVWLLVALVPMSAMFSALCLALAAFARSTKEGQYYLMPLMLVTMPLTILPMAPGVDLNLGNSLIPVTGVILLLRTLLEGSYAEALPYVPLVAGVTLTCCLLAVRWAADQFNKESVLFRESERLDVGLWIKQLLRDREDTPSAPEAVFCGVLILLIQFFMSFAIPPRQNLVVLAIVTQLAVVATPALLMTIMLTRSPRKTLLLRMPRLGVVPATILLAVVLHPVVKVLGDAVIRAYPISEAMSKELHRLVAEVDSVWLLLLVGAIPAVCEELAFRGFILSGLRHLGHRWRAIVLSSIFFGVTHAILQQSLIACLVGVMLGFLAVQTGSLLPGILFHLVHNSLTILSSKITPDVVDRYPLLTWLFKPSGPAQTDGLNYHWQVVVLGALAAAAILIWLGSIPYARSAEESLQEAIEQVAPRKPEVGVQASELA